MVVPPAKYTQRGATSPFVFKCPVKTWGTSPPNFRATSFFLFLCWAGNKQPSLLWVFQSHSTHHYCSVGKHRTADPLAWMVRILHSALCVMGKWWLLVAYEPPPPAWEAGDFPLSKQPYGDSRTIRTCVSALRGRRPRPLVERTMLVTWAWNDHAPLDWESSDLPLSITPYWWRLAESNRPFPDWESGFLTFRRKRHIKHGNK